MRLTVNNREFTWRNPGVVGILNLTPDSFSDGGAYASVDAAVQRALAMIAEGATMIDLGGESTRPGSQPVSVETELDRLLPVLRALPKDQFPISVDSNKPEVQEVVLREGAHIINDIYGGSEELFVMAQKYHAGLILMHTPAPPDIMQSRTHYEDVVEDIHTWFAAKHRALHSYDLPAIWADPGIGFGKTLEQNLALLRNLQRFRFPGWGLLLGTSRKSWIEKLTGAPVEQRLGGSIASVVMAWQQGADLFRVHDVSETVQALQIAQAIAVPNPTNRSKPCPTN